MAGLIPKTPVLLQQPELLSIFSGSTGPDKRVTTNSEMGELVVEFNGNLLWSSGLIEANTLIRREFTVRFPRFHKAKRLTLVFTKYSRGYPRTVRVPWNLPETKTDSSGHKVLVIPPDRTGSPSPVRTARRRAASPGNRRRAARISVPKSSTLRPNPETYNRPLREWLESVDSAGVYSKPLDQIVAQVKWQRTWTGVRTPNFGKLRPGQRPVNPHSVSIKIVAFNKRVAGTAAKTPPAYNLKGGSYTEIYAEPPIPGHVARARNNAIRRLIDEAELGIEANLAQDLAQMNQTFRLIGDSTQRIAKTITELRRKNIPGAVNALMHGRNIRGRMPPGAPSASKSVASNWLELQYGWKPLLQDIVGTLKSLSVLHTTDSVQRVAVSAKANTETATRFPINFNVHFPGSQGTTTTVSQTRCKFILRFRLASPLRSFMAQTGFLNPINLVWEILPFSFVVDWFLPIGPYLEAASAFNGLEFVDGSQTQFTRANTVSAVDFEGSSAGNPTQWAYEHARFYAEYVVLDRVKLVSFPSLTFPSFKNGLASIEHASNGLALLKSVFSK